MPQFLSIRYGSNRKNSGFAVGVQQIIINDKFNEYTLDYDFSLLALSLPLILSNRVKAIALPNVNDAEIPDGTLCLVSGWGETLNSFQSNLILRSAAVPIVNRSDCQKSYRSISNITPRMICAGFKEGGKDGKNSIVLYSKFYLKLHLKHVKEIPVDQCHV